MSEGLCEAAGPSGVESSSWCDPSQPAMMSFLRRSLLALGVTGVIAGVLRLRGTGGVPPQSGGWRELSGPDFR